MGYRRKNKTKKVLEMVFFVVIVLGIGYTFFSMDESLDIVGTKADRLSAPSAMVEDGNFKSVAHLKRKIDTLSADEAEVLYQRYQQSQ